MDLKLSQSSGGNLRPVVLAVAFLLLLVMLACGGSEEITSDVADDIEFVGAPVVEVEDSVWSDDELAYINEMTGYIEPLGTALGNFGEMFQEPDIFDEDWRIMTAMHMAQINLAHEGMVGIKPPATLRKLHSQIVSATTDCSNSTHSAAKGIDNLDVSEILAATKLLENCTIKIGEATTIFELEYERRQSASQSTGDNINGEPKVSIDDTVVNRNANLRAGPGTDFDKVGGLKSGDSVQVIGRNEDGDWYKLASGAWIAAFLVDGAPSTVPIASDIPVAP